MIGHICPQVEEPIPDPEMTLLTYLRTRRIPDYLRQYQTLHFAVGCFVCQKYSFEQVYWYLSKKFYCIKYHFYEQKLGWCIHDCVLYQHLSRLKTMTYIGELLIYFALVQEYIKLYKMSGGFFITSNKGIYFDSLSTVNNLYFSVIHPLSPPSPPLPNYSSKVNVNYCWRQKRIHQIYCFHLVWQ